MVLGLPGGSCSSSALEGGPAVAGRPEAMGARRRRVQPRKGRATSHRTGGEGIGNLLLNLDPIIIMK